MFRSLGTRKTENTSVVAPPMSTPTAMPSRLAIFSMISPTAREGMMGEAPRRSFLQPGACAMTCSMNRSWIASRAGLRFSRSSVGRRFATTLKAVRDSRFSRTTGTASRLPA
jgi:hypothetical protein